MSEERGKFEWGQSSVLMSLVANIMRDPEKSQLATPGDFNPYVEKPKPPKISFNMLKDVFVPKEEKKKKKKYGNGR